MRAKRRAMEEPVPGPTPAMMAMGEDMVVGGSRGSMV